MAKEIGVIMPCEECGTTKNTAFYDLTGKYDWKILCEKCWKKEEKK